MLSFAIIWPEGAVVLLDVVKFVLDKTVVGVVMVVTVAVVMLELQAFAADTVAIMLVSTLSAASIPSHFVFVSVAKGTDDDIFSSLIAAGEDDVEAAAATVVIVELVVVIVATAIEVAEGVSAFLLLLDSEFLISLDNEDVEVAVATELAAIDGGVAAVDVRLAVVVRASVDV